MPQWYISWLCLRGLFGRHHSLAMWKMISSCLMLCIWKERNNQSFEDHCETTVAELKNLFFFLSKPFTNGWLPIIVFIFPVFLIFLIFYLFLDWCLSFILFVYWFALLCVLIHFNYLSKIKLVHVNLQIPYLKIF